MRDVIDQLENYQEYLDALYPSVTAAEVKQVQAASASTGRPPTSPGMLRSLAFAAGFILMVAVGVVIYLVGQPADLEPADGSPTTAAIPTTAPPNTSTSANTTSPTAAPPPTPPPATAPPATPPPETVPPTTATLAPPAGFGGGDLNAAVNPAGNLVLAYWSAEETAVKLVICSDLTCGSWREVVLDPDRAVSPIEGQIEPSFVDMALTATGAPVVVEARGDWSSPALYICDDPACETFGAVDPDEFADFAAVAAAPDGTARIAFSDRWASPRQLRLIVCGDTRCDEESRTIVTLDPEGENADAVHLHVDIHGQVFVSYHREVGDGTTEGRVVICDEPLCADPKLLTFADAVAPRVVSTPDGGYRVFYRSGPFMLGEGDINVDAILDAWDLLVADCDAAGCSEAARVQVGWGVLMSWPGDVLQWADAEVLVASGYWSPFHCSPVIDVTRVDLSGDTPTATTTTMSLTGWQAELVILGGTPILVHDTEDGGLALVEITPGAPGGSVPVQC